MRGVSFVEIKKNVWVNPGYVTRVEAGTRAVFVDGEWEDRECSYIQILDSVGVPVDMKPSEVVERLTGQHIEWDGVDE